MGRDGWAGVTIFDSSEDYQGFSQRHLVVSEGLRPGRRRDRAGLHMRELGETVFSCNNPVKNYRRKRWLEQDCRYRIRIKRARRGDEFDLLKSRSALMRAGCMDAIKAPDEIWLAGEFHGATYKPVLQCRYIAQFLVEGEKQPGISVFEWGRDGWTRGDDISNGRRLSARDSNGYRAVSACTIKTATLTRCGLPGSGS